MSGVPVPSDRTEGGNPRERIEPDSGAPAAVMESATPQVADECEPVPQSTLADDVRCALASSAYSCLRRVVAATSGRNVVLSGTVPSYYLKQLAQTVVMAVPGVGVVRNELDVGLGG